MTDNILEVLNQTQHNIQKRTNIGMLVIAIAIIAISVLLLVMEESISGGNQTLQMFIYVLSPILAIVGLYVAFAKTSEQIYVPTKSTVKKYSDYVGYENMNQMLELLQTEEICTPDKVKIDGTGNFRVDTVVTKDQKFSACIVYQFVPYNYQPATTLMVVDGPKADVFHKRLASLR